MNNDRHRPHLPRAIPPPTAASRPPIRGPRVQADRSRIERQQLGGETRVRVPLSGPVNENWRRAYRLLQLDSTGYFRFRLELESAVVTFTSRHADGTLLFLMEQLDGFLDLVNAKASTDKGI